MITVKIKSPVFQIVLDKNVNYLERATLKFFRDGWYPVGGIGRKLNDWVQVMVRDEVGEEFAVERSETQLQILMDDKVEEMKKERKEEDGT
jgi:hypothetical protein